MQFINKKISKDDIICDDVYILDYFHNQIINEKILKEYLFEAKQGYKIDKTPYPMIMNLPKPSIIALFPKIFILKYNNDYVLLKKRLINEDDLSITEQKKYLFAYKFIYIDIKDFNEQIEFEDCENTFYKWKIWYKKITMEETK